jgi:hypothetical protein
VGFDSEEALKLHTQEEHVKPLQNPLKYAQENLASTLCLDSQGQSKKAPKTTSQETVTTSVAVKMIATASKQGQTPNIKSENTPAVNVATPMNRQISMNRPGSAVETKFNGPATSKSQADTAKDALSKAQAEQKNASKQQPSQHTQEAVKADLWANTTIDPHDLFQSFQGFESGAGGAISDMNVYRSITPNDTPESSKDGVSEPNSDISEGVGLDISIDIFDDKGMQFVPSDTDYLFDMNNFNVTGDDDLTMFDDEKSAPNFQSWDDMVDLSVFDKPFTFDTSFYSMNAE